LGLDRVLSPALAGLFFSPTLARGAKGRWPITAVASDNLVVGRIHVPVVLAALAKCHGALAKIVTG
jgi:hypothetical protein